MIELTTVKLVAIICASIIFGGVAVLAISAALLKLCFRTDDKKAI
ncbi:hypothetical protein [Nonlabens dokdonensis]|nr:hypothetical protein [Nonlabens dokdonensis]